MIKINRLYEDSKNFDKFEVHGGVFNKDTELEFAKQFEWIPPVETIKVKGIRGHISESDIELKIMLSDHGSIAYIATDKMSKLSIDGNLIDPKWFNDYIGKNGSVVGDLLDLYKDYKDRKITPGSL